MSDKMLEMKPWWSGLGLTSPIMCIYPIKSYCREIATKYKLRELIRLPFARPAYRGVSHSIGMGSLQGMTSSFQYGNRTFTGKVTFRERSHTIVRALGGRLSCKRTNFSEYVQAIQVQVAT